MQSTPYKLTEIIFNLSHVFLSLSRFFAGILLKKLHFFLLCNTFGTEELQAMKLSAYLLSFTSLQFQIYRYIFFFLQGDLKSTAKICSWGKKKISFRLPARVIKPSFPPYSQSCFSFNEYFKTGSFQVGLASIFNARHIFIIFFFLFQKKVKSAFQRFFSTYLPSPPCKGNRR